MKIFVRSSLVLGDPLSSYVGSNFIYLLINLLKLWFTSDWLNGCKHAEVVEKYSYYLVNG